MATFRVHSSALHDPNLPVDAATENAISYFYSNFFGRFDDHCPRGISQMFLFLTQRLKQNSI